MERTPLTYFLAVCRTGSLAKAGRSMGVTPQAVGKAISALEKELGYSLLERTIDGSKPTILGREVCNIAERVERFQAGAYEQMRALRNTAIERSTVNLGIYQGFLQIMPITMISDFLELYPEISLNVHEYSEKGECEKALCTGKIDVGFGAHLYDEELLEPLYTYKSNVYAIVGNQHRLAGKESVSVEDLRGEKIIISQGLAIGGYVHSEGEMQSVSLLDVLKNRLAEMDTLPRLTLPDMSEMVRREMVLKYGYVSFNLCPKRWLPYGIVPIQLEGVSIQGSADFLRARNQQLTRAAQRYIDFILPRFREQIG